MYSNVFGIFISVISTTDILQKSDVISHHHMKEKNIWESPLFVEDQYFFRGSPLPTNSKPHEILTKIGIDLTCNEPNLVPSKLCLFETVNFLGIYRQKTPQIKMIIRYADVNT